MKKDKGKAKSSSTAQRMSIGRGTEPRKLPQAEGEKSAGGSLGGATMRSSRYNVHTCEAKPRTG